MSDPTKPIAPKVTRLCPEAQAASCTIEPLESRVLLSANSGDWRLATGLTRTTTHLHSGISGVGVRAASAGNLAFFSSASGSRPTKNVAVYDVQTRRWSQIKLSRARYRGADVAVQNTVLFAGGVVGRAVPIDTVDLFDV